MDSVSLRRFANLLIYFVSGLLVGAVMGSAVGTGLATYSSGAARGSAGGQMVVESLVAAANQMFAPLMYALVGVAIGAFAAVWFWKVEVMDPDAALRFSGGIALVGGVIGMCQGIASGAASGGIILGGALLGGGLGLSYGIWTWTQAAARVQAGDPVLAADPADFDMAASVASPSAPPDSGHFGPAPVSPVSPYTIPAPASAAGPNAGSPFDSLNGCALLMASPGAKDYPRWGQLLASVCHLLPIDAVQKLRAHRGAVILPDLKPDIADAFARLLEAEGTPVIRVPTSKLLTFSFCGQVKHLAYAEPGIVITDQSERVNHIPWNQLILLTVGLFQATGVTGPDGMIDAGKGHVGADLFALHDGQAFQFALDLRSLSYAHLGERMANNGLANLRLTVADLMGLAPQMHCNDSARALVESGRARNFKDMDDYNGEVTGLAQLIQATRGTPG